MTGLVSEFFRRMGTRPRTRARTPEKGGVETGGVEGLEGFPRTLAPPSYLNITLLPPFPNI
jgi:hypothetical protein